jgi:hypothetical protein
MLKALFVTPKKAFALLPMLRRLWGFDTEKDVAVVTRLLSSRSLAVEKIRDGVRGITLHDLVLDYCVKQAEERGCAASWYRRHLDGYVADLLDVSTGNVMRNLEEVIGYCQASMWGLTRERAPHDWATIQRHPGDDMMKRLAGKRSANVEGAIACYRSAIATWTKDEAAQDWALTQRNLGEALRDRVVGKKWSNTEECILCYRGALDVWTRDDYPKNWAYTQVLLGDALTDRVGGDKTSNTQE